MILKHNEPAVNINGARLLNLTVLLSRGRWSLILVALAMMLVAVPAVSTAKDKKAPVPGTNEYYLALAKDVAGTAERFELKSPYCSSAEKNYDINFLEDQLSRVDKLRSEISNAGRIWQTTREYTREARAQLRRKLAEARKRQVEDCSGDGSSTAQPVTTAPLVEAGRSAVGIRAPKIADAFGPKAPSKLCSQTEKNSYIQVLEEALKNAQKNLDEARRYEDSLEDLKNGPDKKRLKNEAIELTARHRKIREKLKKTLQTIKAMEIEDCSEAEKNQRLTNLKLRFPHVLSGLGIIPLDIDETGNRRTDGGNDESSDEDTERSNPDSEIDYGNPGDNLRPRARYRYPGPGEDGTDSDGSSGSPEPDTEAENETGYEFTPGPIHQGGGMTEVPPPSDPSILDGEDWEDSINPDSPNLSDTEQPSRPRRDESSGTNEESNSESRTLRTYSDYDYTGEKLRPRTRYQDYTRADEETAKDTTIDKETEKVPDDEK